jgi:hypothetical protein
VIRKSRLPIVLGLALALGVSGVAVAGGTSDAEQTQKAAAGISQSSAITTHLAVRTRPLRLPRRNYRNARLFFEVAHDNADGSPDPPPGTRRVIVDFGNNVRVNLDAHPRCRANLEGTTTQQARQRCGRALIGVGSAEARLPGPYNVTDLVVSVFNGSNLRGTNRIRAHVDSQGQLPPGATTQVIQARIVSAPGRQFNRRLVAEVPAIVGGEGTNTQFNATIRRNTGIVRARCMARRIPYRAFWIFRDDTPRESNTASERCRRAGG